MKLSNNSCDFIAIGKFGSPWGVSGEIKLQLYNPDSEYFKKARPVFINPTGFSFQQISITKVKKVSKHWVLKIEGYSSPEQVRSLVNLEFFVTKAELESTIQKGEFLVFQLQNFEVFSQGEFLGKVSQILDYGASSILQVTHVEKGIETLIPFVKDFVLHVDSAQKKIEVKWEAFGE